MKNPKRQGIFECLWQVPNENYLKDADEPKLVERACYNYFDGAGWHHGVSSLRAYRNVVAAQATIPIASTDGWVLLGWRGKT